MDYKVKDIGLSEGGRLRVEWALDHMPVLAKLRKEYGPKKPLEGYRIGGAIHVTKETASLIHTLRELGAEVSWCGCNPLSTQDDVAASLAEDGISVFAWRGLSEEQYYWCIDRVCKTKPHFTMDDGADLVFWIHEKLPRLISGVVGGTEETTTGVKRLKNMARDGALRYPIIAVNNAQTKQDFDNVYGTAQGTMDAIMRATSVMIAGQTVVVAGYGHCGRGVAMRAHGMGADVIVTEVNPIYALQAAMNGFRVMSMDDAIEQGDIFITATGCKSIITRNHFPRLKDGAILVNVGHFDVEVRVDQLEEYALEKTEIRPNTEQFLLPGRRKVYLIAQGRLANLGAAEGHPSGVMDLSFSNQVLALIELSRGKFTEPGVYEISREQDERIAQDKLEAMGISIDSLTEEQDAYLRGWKEGT
ncbi:MAG: adenosylhomocysteinase [Thermoplasmata archaeon]